VSKIAKLFASPQLRRIEGHEKELMRDGHKLRHEIVKLEKVVGDKDRLIAKLKVDLHNLRHQRSGLYHFRVEEMRLLAQAVECIEKGEHAYGVRLLAGVLDDLRPDWRELA